MAEDLTVTGMIRSILQSELRYLRHYIGQVSDNQDPNFKGRVRIKVTDLGWDTDDKAPWCWPRQLHSMDVPKVGEWVEVYFINGDRTRAVYLGQASEILEQIPAGYSDPDKRLLFQDPDNGDSIEYDVQNKKLMAIIQNITIEADGTNTNLNIILDSDSIKYNGQARTLNIAVNGNTIKTETGKVSINGHLEVTQ